MLVPLAICKKDNSILIHHQYSRKRGKAAARLTGYSGDTASVLRKDFCLADSQEARFAV